MKIVRLAPWEEVTYFQTPKVSYINVGTADDWVQIAPANPQRVAIIMSCGVQVFVSPDHTLPQNYGLVLNANTATLGITEAQYGPLCTGAWYAYGSGNQPVTVVEIILREMPQ